MSGKGSSKEARKQAREGFMQLLYEMEIHQDYSLQRKEQFLSQLAGYRKFAREDEQPSKMPGNHSVEVSYINRMYELISERLNQIDETLTQASENWKLERFARVDLAVLRLAVAEILFEDEIPDSVSINEAVELAKKYGSEDSGKFVNGVLGRVARGKDETVL